MRKNSVPLLIIAGTAALLLLSVFAFWPAYLSKQFPGLDGYTHFHAVVGLLWLLLLAAQALLIIRARRSMHRALGRLTFVVAPLFVLSSVLLAHYRFSRMDPGVFEREAYSLYLPLSAALLFSVAYWLGLRTRRVLPLHGRFMACTALLLVDPVLGRFLAFYVLELPRFWHYQVITFGLELLVVFVLWRTLPALTPKQDIFLGFLGAYSVVLLMWFVAPRTDTWLSFATWFRELPLT